MSPQSKQARNLTAFIASVFFVFLAVGVSLAFASLTFTNNNITGDSGTEITIGNGTSTVSFPGNVSTTNLSASCSQVSLEKDLRCYSGADYGERLYQCITDASAANGTCNALSVTGPQTINSNPTAPGHHSVFAGVTNPVTVLLGDVTVDCYPDNAVSYCLYVPSNVTIVGDHHRTVLREPASVAAFSSPSNNVWYSVITSQTGAANLDISGITFTGGDDWNYSTNQQEHAIVLGAAVNPYIHDNQLNGGWNGDGTVMYGGVSVGYVPVTGARIQRNYYTGNFREQVSLDGVDGADISNNWMYGTGSNAVHGEPDSSGDIQRNIAVHDNLIEPTTPGSGGISFTSPINTESALYKNIRIYNNMLIGTPGIVLMGHTDSYVAGNTVQDSVPNGTGGAIFLGSPNSIVSNNIVKWVNTTAHQAGITVECHFSTCSGSRGGYTLAGNSVSRAYGSGIDVESAPHTSIIGGTIDGVLPNVISVAISVGAAGGSTGDDYTTIDGVTIQDSQTPPTTQYAYSIRAGSNNLVGNNTVSNMTVGTWYSDSQSHTQTTGSQWTTSGTAIYYNGGTVGIGTTAPYASSTLDVNGTLYVGGGSSSSPSIAFRSTLPGVYNNGLYYYGSGQLGIAEGGANAAVFAGVGNVAGQLFVNPFSTAGTAANHPSYAFTNDQTTGMFRYGAGVLGLDASGTMAMVLNSSGTVGIGTTTPATALDVNGDITDENLKSRSCVGTDATGKLQAGTCSGGGGGSISSSSAITPFYFPYWANTTGGLSGTSTIFISSSTGTVGIGTTAPYASSTLDVNGTLYVGAGSSGTPSIAFRGSSLGVYNNGLYFYGSGKLGIAEGGANVGYFVGVGNVAGALDINPYSTAGTAANYPSYAFTNDAATGMFRYGAGVLGLDASGTTAMVLNSSGDVGIGTTAPSTTFQVAGASSTIRIGASALPGCLEMGNSDGSAGINYITVLNGTLTATTTKPSTCQ